MKWTYFKQGPETEIEDLRGDCVVCHKPLWPSRLAPVYGESIYTGFKSWVHNSMSGGCCYTFAHSRFYDPITEPMTADEQNKFEKEEALDGSGPIAERLDEEDYRDIHRNDDRQERSLKF